jgi:hypothetical protein
MKLIFTKNKKKAKKSALKRNPFKSNKSDFFE